jgi:glycosyltransferase involved in cell wall biosynthesis
MAAPDDPSPAGPVFVLPSRLSDGAGPTAAWITAAGWAGAAATVWGDAWLIGPDGPVTLDAAQLRAAQPRPERARARRPLPVGAATLAKDLRALGEGWRGRARALRGPWRRGPIPFVWQRHALFERAGLELARAARAPFVLSVHALQVREARSWGVDRPGWGGLAERAGERPALRAADVVAAGSEEVATSARDLGVPAKRIVVTPNEVDLEHVAFDPAGRERVRRRHGLEGFVVGWVGSFRSFHGLEAALHAVAAVQRRRPDVTLLLIGDGLHRPRLEAEAQRLGLRAVFTGTVPYADMPAHISAMDATLSLSGRTREFHYSPVKLREYMACARPVVAHRAGEMGRELADGETALLVDPDEPAGLATALLRLADDPALAERLGTAARRAVAARGGWQRPVATVAHALGLSAHEPR